MKSYKNGKIERQRNYSNMLQFTGNVTKIVELAYAIGRSQQTIIKALR